MIAGILLLYIGMRLGFSFLYRLGCWFLIGINSIKYLMAFLNSVYGVKDGK